MKTVRHIFRSRLVLLILIGAIVLAALSCSKKSDGGGKTTIIFWHSFVSSTVPALNDLIAAFEKEHPDIHIQAQYIPTGDALIQKLITSIQSNTAPDISWIHADFLDKLVASDAIYPMDDFIKGQDGVPESTLADIYAPLLQSAKYRGTLYALPMEATSLALFYNKKLFKNAGLDPVHPPQNWAELETYAKKLTHEPDAQGRIDQYGLYVPVFPASGGLSIWMILQWTPFLWQAGGEEIDSAQTHLEFNSPAGVAALSLWKRMYDAGYMNTFTMAHDMAFASEHVGMILDGPWNLPKYRLLTNVDWAAAPLPAGPAGKATYIAGEHLAIFRQSKHPDEAWKFVKWMLDPKVQAMFSMKSGYLPIRRAVMQIGEYKDFLSHDAAMKTFVDQMEFGRGRRPIDIHRVEINQALAEAIEKATLGKGDPKTMLDQAVAKGNQLLKEAASR